MNRPRRTFPNRRRTAGPIQLGFTLVELLIVLAIMGIAAAIVVPRYGSATQTYKLKVSAARIVSDLNSARDLAVASSRHHRIVFTKGRGGYWVVPGDGPTSGALWHSDISLPPYESQVFSADFGGSWTASFTGFGDPAAPGTVTIGAGPLMTTVSLSKDGAMSTGAITRIPAMMDRTGLDPKLLGR